MTMPKVAQVLVVADPCLQQTATGILRAAGHDVTSVTSASEARAWLTTHHTAVAIVAIDMKEWSAAHEDELLDNLRGAAAPTGTKIVGLVRANDEAELCALFEKGRLANFLSVSDEGAVEPVDLAVTISKLVGDEIFGLERYLGAGTPIQARTLRRSADKNDVVDDIERFARQAGCHRSMAQGVGVAADELITNALFNAPVDEHGNRRFAHLPRELAIELAPGEEVTVRWGFDGRVLGISAIDPFGSLAADRVLDYLAKCLAKGDRQIDTKQGGAGLGLYYLFRLMHHFVVNIAPGRQTEAMGLVAVETSYRAYTAKARSLNVFVGEEANGH